MKSKSSIWFEIALSRYMLKENRETQVKEKYVVEAATFTEAEAKIQKELKGSRLLIIKNINPCPFSEVFFADSDVNCKKWFKAKLAFLVMDEETEKEKRNNVTYLVQAEDLQGAIDNMNEVMKSSLQEFVMANISETKYEQVFVRLGGF